MEKPENVIGKIAGRVREGVKNVPKAKEIKIALAALTLLQALNHDLQKPADDQLIFAPQKQNQEYSQAIERLPSVAEAESKLRPIEEADRSKYKDTLPEDVVSEDELWQNYRTRISNTDEVELLLRRRILETEPIFEHLSSQATGSEEGQKPQLDLIFVQEPFHPYMIEGSDGFRSRYMTEKQKQLYPEVYKFTQDLEWGEIKKAVQAKKEDLIQFGKEEEAKMKSLLSSGKMSKEEFETNQKELNRFIAPYKEDLLKTDFETFSKKYRDHELMVLPFAYGFFLRYPQDFGPEEKDKEGFPRRYFILISLPYRAYDFALNPDKSSFVPSENFRVNPNNQRYPVSAPNEASVGWGLRHELRHFLPNSPATGFFLGHPGPDYSALEQYQKAEDLLREGDDSLFYIVFKTRRGIVVTEDQPKETQRNT